MAGKATIIAGIVIPSDSPSFLTFVGLHVLVALACVITGVVAMLSNKRPGQHPMFGTIYYWCLSAVFASATVLSAMRWADDYHLFILGMLSFAAATVAARLAGDAGATGPGCISQVWAPRTSCCSLLSTLITARTCPYGRSFLQSRFGSCQAQSGCR